MNFNLSNGIVLQGCFHKMQRCRFSNRTSKSTRMTRAPRFVDVGFGNSPRCFAWRNFRHNWVLTPGEILNIK